MENLPKVLTFKQLKLKTIGVFFKMREENLTARLG